MRRIRLDRRRFLALAAGGGLGAGLLPAGRTASAAEGRILRVQNDEDVENLDPANRHGWYDELIMFAIYSGLCLYKPGKDWSWRLDAAETLIQTDPLAVEFALRPGLQWTNGFGEVTADDVKYSYERFLDPRVHADYATDWEALDRVEITGRYSGVIRLKHPFSPLFASTLPHASGLLVCRKAVEAIGGLIDTTPPATSGPYRIGQWVPRQRLVLVRHELWNGPRPYYDEIQILPMTQEEGETAFDAGDLDMTKIIISSIPVVAAAKDPGVTMTSMPALAYHWLGMNMTHPKLADLRVRRAIQHAVDVPAVLQATFGGMVPQAFGVVPTPLAGARTRNLYGYDPAESKRLLGEAGVTGLELRLDLGQNEDHLTAAQVIQAQLAAVGIAVHIHTMDAASFIALHENAQGDGWRDTQLHVHSATTAPDASWVTPWFTCEQVGIWNFERVCDPKWDALSRQAVPELDPAKRAEIYVQLQDMLEETGAYVFLFYGLNTWLTRAALKGAWTPDGQWPLLRDVAPAES
jgi:peptide/nickel transport system substrate-binding protein